MKTWQDADTVLKKASEQADMEYLFGNDSIHAKYTEFIKQREEKLALEQQEWARIMEERRKRREQNIPERS